MAVSDSASPLGHFTGCPEVPRRRITRPRRMQWQSERLANAASRHRSPRQSLSSRRQVACAVLFDFPREEQFPDDLQEVRDPGRGDPGSTTPGSPRWTSPPRASARSGSCKQPSDSRGAFSDTLSGVLPGSKSRLPSCGRPVRYVLPGRLLKIESYSAGSPNPPLGARPGWPGGPRAGGSGAPSLPRDDAWTRWNGAQNPSPRAGEMAVRVRVEFGCPGVWEYDTGL